MSSLADSFCPPVHDGPVTAVAYEPESGTLATADASGRVLVRRSGQSGPLLDFCPGGPVEGALALSAGGALVAVGDELGTVGVYQASSGAVVFRESREGARGRSRAMRGLAFNPEASLLAAIARDGILRLWDLQRGSRRVSWRGFGGRTVDFSPQGKLLLAVDERGQPRLVDLLAMSGLPLDPLPFPVERARFDHDGQRILALGPSGLALLRVSDGRLLSSFATKGGSGLLEVLLSPDGERVAVITHRSVHLFELPELEPGEHWHHGAPRSSGAGAWLPDGIRVAGADGALHGGEEPAPGAVELLAANAEQLAAAHGRNLAYWKGSRRALLLELPEPPSQLALDREGRLLALGFEQHPLRLLALPGGELLFEGAPDTVAPRLLAVGGSVLLAQLRSGTTRWYELEGNHVFDLPWPRSAALSGSGALLAVLGPGGPRVLDPGTGRPALPDPVPTSDVPVERVAFVNRRPELLTVDADGVLTHYRLELESAAEGRDLLDFDLPVTGLWGTPERALLRLLEGERALLVGVELATGEVREVLEGLSPAVTVNPETGLVLEPARASAVLERELSGRELRVFRSLAGGQWIAFSPRSILEHSDDVARALLA